MSLEELKFWFQVAIGAASIVGSVFGWLLKTLWEAHKDLVAADKALTEDVSKIKVLVAGEYVKRDEFRESSNAIFRKLDQIILMMNGKVDRP